MRTLMTLCLVREPGRILLGMKKLGMGAGKWNGFGGHVQENESIEAAAKRELQEEAGVKADEMERMGILELRNSSNEQMIELHIFRARQYSGELTESDEMRPEWFPLDKIPYDLMWRNDAYWLPLFLDGKKFKGVFLFGTDDTVLEYELNEVHYL